MSKSLKHLSDEVQLSGDDPFIDFSSAGLYLVGLQTTVATVACAATSVACCWMLPTNMVSAVRTLAITAFVAFLFMRNPIRVGRVRGVTIIFNALRPCVIVYISVLTVEQLVHACVPMESKQPAYSRRVVFHCSIAMMAAAGLWRAAKPRSEADAPFLVTLLAVVVITMLPPPPAPLSGPLCEAATLFSAAERLTRAFLFAALYVVHVYCAAPSRNSVHELAVCIMRCSASAVWVLGCHLFVVWVALLQAVVAMWARFGSESSNGSGYANVDTRSDSGISDAELGNLADMSLPRDSNGVLIAPWQCDSPPNHHGFSSSDPIMSQTNLDALGAHAPLPSLPSHAPHAPHPPRHTQPSPPHLSDTSGSLRAPSPAMIGAEGVRVDPRQLAGLVANGCQTMTRERLAAIAASLQQ